MRLRNGHLSTEREAVDWERRNEQKRNEYVQNFLKQAGISLNRAPADRSRPRVKPNQACPCGSQRKFKKCCG